MDKIVVIEGKTYKLVPVEEHLVDAYSGVVPKVEHGPVKAEISGSSPIPRAQPKVSDYRERYKKHEIRPDETIAKPSFPSKLLKKNKSINLGEGDFFGPGLEMDS